MKEELAAQAQAQPVKKDEEVKLTKNMTIPDMVKVMMPEIKKALPSVMSPERFTRIALSALNNTPQLQACTPMSFLAALLNSAQLGLEPNTPLGQAYLIPYKNHGKLECQFQIGYKGLIDLAYRNGQMQTIQAQAVYENDEFFYEYGLDAKLRHRPAFSDRGDLIYFYGIFKTGNGGYGFSVMSKNDMDIYAKTYSNMKPQEAASIFDTMTDNLGLVADILMNMGTQQRADILGKMDATTAAKLTEIMEPSKKK